MRLYRIIYEENGIHYEAIFPESGIPEVINMVKITLLGQLHPEYQVIKIPEDPDDPSREDLPIKLVRKDRKLA